MEYGRCAAGALDGGKEYDMTNSFFIYAIITISLLMQFYSI